jgi:hypothetical protein
MTIDGFYYLHSESRDLIYKRGPDVVADLRDSDFMRHFWLCDPEDHENAWDILVEAGALGAKPERIVELAAKWGCTDKDADVYAERCELTIDRDGNLWCASGPHFTNLAQSHAGFGSTKLHAMIDLCKQLGMIPAKMRGPTFKSLLRDEKPRA